ncbi:hypothetical protein [Streptosporangium sp. NPDC051022]|uniref:hypothetical protein n=1 Tax=Streptosporangium sp. NPDC051022 TaxID=3155752 RepID=UPI00341A7346
MSRPQNTRDEIIPIPAMHGVHLPGAIEAQEAAGGEAMAAGDCEVIPARGSDALALLGFSLGEVDSRDPLFRTATLPEGWKRAASDHAMWTHLVDELGRKRVAMFYKASWYDRKAFCQIESVYSYISTCLYEDTTPVLDETWATRDAVLEALEEVRKSEQETLDLWFGRPESFAAEYEAQSRETLTKVEALRAELAGGAA